MRVKELIEELLKFDLELPVCLADWNEQYLRPDEGAVCANLITNGRYTSVEADEFKCAIVKTGDYVCIGVDE